jgi:hypothetical protein
MIGFSQNLVHAHKSVEMYILNFYSEFFNVLKMFFSNDGSMCSHVPNWIFAEFSGTDFFF